jgi:short-subunit dehydrogenase
VTETREQGSGNIAQWMWLGAGEVAAAGYEAAEAKSPICVPGAANKALAALSKLIPDD